MKALQGKPLYVPYNKVFEYNKCEWEETTCVYQVGEHYMFDRDKKVDAENLAWKLDLPLYERKVIFYKEVDEFLGVVCNYYKEHGVGKFGMFKAFRINHENNQGSVEIEPVVSVEHIYLYDLIGYDAQKKKLTENTEAFLRGRKANNVLLFGDSGTGKSSSVKAILNEYYEHGLRMIEIYKHQFHDLSAVINQIKDRNYKFIIFMDDLSFEEFEIEYKFLKAVIEGGLEKKPDNVLIYATSNRRHLVREKFSDKEERDDDLHSRDTVQEKLSLAARFGVSIYYGSPDKKQFNEIIKGLAKKNNIQLDEKLLLAEANKWEISHGGLSGRNAQQFMNYLSYFEASPNKNN